MRYFIQSIIGIFLIGLCLVSTSCRDNNDVISDQVSFGDGMCEGDGCLVVDDVSDDNLENIDMTTPVEPGVVYITMMVHIEGWTNENTLQESFEEHADVVRRFAALFTEHNAKATFEAKPSFVEGCSKWNDNVLLELYNEGFGIGVHADAGGQVEQDNLTQEQFTKQIAEMKTNIEAVLGYEVRHVSGICSTLDWVKAAIDAGYSFTSGMVGYCAMSLPEEERPDEYKDCVAPSQCHGEIPLALEDRVHPWRASSGLNWTVDDPEGDLIIFAPENILSTIGEGNSTFDDADIEEYIKRLDEAITYSEEGKITTLYVGWSIGDSDIDEEMMEKWFDAIEPYIDSGKVKWKTLPEMYDAYIE